MSNRRAYTRDEIVCLQDSKALKDMCRDAVDAIEGIETMLDFSSDEHPNRTSAVTALIHWKRARRDIIERLQEIAA